MAAENTPGRRPALHGDEARGCSLDDASFIALKTFTEMKSDLAAAIGSSQNGRRLLAMPELRDDVAFCAQLDVFDLVAVMDKDGAIRAR